MNYFNKLPPISYNNSIAVNILSRAKLSDNTKGDSRVFLPYTLEDGDRVDMLSRAYYGDPGYTWLVWMSNEVIDPYYDMALSDYDVMELIKIKYGSIELAQRKIAFYRTNGDTNPRLTDEISAAEFNNLVLGRQKYWSPMLDYLLNVKGYERNKDPQIINTNRIAAATISMVNGQFKLGEEIQRNGTNYGFATYVSTTDITLQHMTGEFIVGTTVSGKETGATATVISCNNSVSVTPAHTDNAYWDAVSFFDYEIEENQKKREVLLVDSRYKSQVEQELRRTLDPR
jgi:hypothetical protein